MMEKSSSIVLSEEEKAIIKNNSRMTKTASAGSNEVPARFKDWYSQKELEKIANEQD